MLRCSLTYRVALPRPIRPVKSTSLVAYKAAAQLGADKAVRSGRARLAVVFVCSHRADHVPTCPLPQYQNQSRAIVARRKPMKVPKPKWHAPWKLMRVISGHVGWPRSVTVEPGNQWFATGAGDRTIKVRAVIVADWRRGGVVCCSAVVLTAAVVRGWARSGISQAAP